MEGTRTDYSNIEGVVRVIERLPLGLCVVSPDLTYHFVNNDFASMFGYQPEEMAGLSVQSVTHQDYMDSDRELSRQVFAHEIPYFRLRKKWFRKDGSILEGDLYATTIPYDGSDWGLATITPIWDTRILTHDLRNIIQVMYATTQNIKANFGESDSTKSLEKSINVAIGISSNLLSATDTDSDAARTDEVIKTCVSIFQPSLDDNITLKIEELVAHNLSISEVKFTQILMNLLTNAKESLDGEGQISINCVELDGNVVVTVQDNGIGMSAEVARAATERGYSQGKPGGTGLGLAFVKEAVEAVGGSLAIESTLNSGSHISVTIPIA